MGILRANRELSDLQYILKTNNNTCKTIKMFFYTNVLKGAINLNS